jgi:hypothetical protein
LINNVKGLSQSAGPFDYCPVIELIDKILVIDKTVSPAQNGTWMQKARGNMLRVPYKARQAPSHKEIIEAQRRQFHDTTFSPWRNRSLLGFFKSGASQSSKRGSVKAAKIK